MHFKMPSAICFNLDQSKILSSGNGLRSYTRSNITTAHIKPTLNFASFTSSWEINLEIRYRKGENLCYQYFRTFISILFVYS